MSDIRFEARDYLNYLQSGNQIIGVAHYTGTERDGKGRALILNSDDRVAVMLEDCGDPSDSGVRAGDLINYIQPPEAEPRIVGTPASVRA